jgi:LPXTG-site transpeptidase (sortase) family protein
VRITYKKANNVLLVLIILINSYVIAAPFLPQLEFWNHHGDGTKQALTQQVQKPAPTNQPNHIVIPDMLLDKPINEGPVSTTYANLRKGIWRWPNSSTPDKPGNTVLVGHRFTYTNPRGVFYYLDKVKVGSEIAVFWNNKKYVYKVEAVKVVSKTDISVQGPTNDTRLTIYTCTPLWHPVNRLVVVAKPEVQP